RQKAGVGLESHLSEVMKHEIRDYDVKLFSGSEPKYVALLKINSVRETKNSCILFRLLDAGLFEACMFKCVNPSYLRILIEFSTDAAQESKTTSHIENPQLIISPKWKRSESICEHSLHNCTYLLGSHRGSMVICSEIWFLYFFSLLRWYRTRIQLSHQIDGQDPNIYLQLYQIDEIAALS